MKINRLKYKIIYCIIGLLLSTNISYAEVKEIDPFESINRPIFVFNTVFDKIILVPIATIYRDIIPDIIKIPLENIVSQIKYPISSVNYALQGKWDLSMHSLKKLSTNMILTLGTGHIKLDEEIDKNYKYTNFNTTLNLQNVESGPYIVLPILGGSSVRGAISKLVDTNFIPLNKKLKTNISITNALVQRSYYIDKIYTLEETSVDYYSAVRNIIMQVDDQAGNKEPETHSIEDFDFSDDEELDLK